MNSALAEQRQVRATMEARRAWSENERRINASIQQRRDGVELAPSITERVVDHVVKPFFNAAAAPASDLLSEVVAYQQGGLTNTSTYTTATNVMGFGKYAVNNPQALLNTNVSAYWQGVSDDIIYTYENTDGWEKTEIVSAFIGGLVGGRKAPSVDYELGVKPSPVRVDNNGVSASFDNDIIQTNFEVGISDTFEVPVWGVNSPTTHVEFNGRLRPVVGLGFEGGSNRGIGDIGPRFVDSDSNLVNVATEAHSASNFAKLKAQLRVDELKSNGFYKPNGGRTEGDFINEHAFSRHGNNLNVTSNHNRSQFDPNIDVAKLRSDTISNYDRTYSDIQSRATVYEKSYNFDISTTINDIKVAPTSNSSNVHKVFVSPDPELSTQFPLAPRHIKGR